LFPLFATGVVDTGGNLVAGVIDTGGNLPLALLTPRQICHRYQQHKRYWWLNLPPMSLRPVANFLPVLLIPVVHLDLRISPRIFEKF
jgi:hypothetical protein